MKAGFATLHELKTIYGVKDLYDFVEIIYIDNYNEMIINEYLERKNKNGS